MRAAGTVRPVGRRQLGRGRPDIHVGYRIPTFTCTRTMRARRGFRRATVATVLGAAVALLARARRTGAGAAPTAPLTSHQRAVLHGIARDTWRFYGADVDPTTHLPLDNLGPGRDPRPVHVGRQHRRLPVGGGRGARPRADHTARADQLAAATLGEVATLKRFDGLLYQWYDTDNGRRAAQPRSGRLHRDDPGAGQLLVRLGRRQRLVRVRADRGPPGAARGSRPRRPAAGADGLLDLLRQPAADRLQRQRVARRQSADRPEVRRLLRRPGSGRLPQQRAVQRPSDRDVHRHGPPPDARRRVVALVADAAAAAVRHRPGSPSRDMPVAGSWQTLHRPAVGQGVPGVGGPLHLPRDPADVRADVRRRHVRGADGQPGRARDELGSRTAWASTTCAGRRFRSSTRPRCCSYPVWGISPSSTADDTGDYGGFGVEGQAFARGPARWRSARPAPPRRRCRRTPRRSRCRSCRSRPTPTWSRSAPTIPGSTRRTAASMTRSTRRPASIGHRRLVLDQSMIMAALDDALDGALQRYFAARPGLLGRAAVPLAGDDVDLLRPDRSGLTSPRTTPPAAPAAPRARAGSGRAARRPPRRASRPAP